MHTAKGKPVWQGVVAGTLRRYVAPKSRSDAQNGLTPEQQFLLAREQAVQGQRMLAEQMRAQTGEEVAALFNLHAAMLEDEDFSDLVRSGIEKGLNAADAVRVAGERMVTDFESLEDPYLRERANDVRDMVEEVLSALGEDRAPDLKEDVILMAEDLLPSQLARLDQKHLRGVVTRTGGINSHTAILARAMGVPMLVACKDLDPDWEGRNALLDTYEGTLYVDPTPEICMREESTRREKQMKQCRAEDPIMTAAGRRIRICANVGGLRDLEAARRAGAEGIGLFRTEFLCLGQDRILAEEEQYRIYRQAAETMAPHPVVVRTWDFDTDKGAEFVPSACGLRGVQLCLARDELFRPQLRALLRAAAHGVVNILLPMVTCAAEVRACKQLLADCRKQLEREGVSVGSVKVGAMIETPAAALCATELAKECDFFSLGTNDLTRYTCAVDRQQMLDGRPHPAVLRLMRMAIGAAKRKDIPVGICGEMGNDPEHTQMFLRMGVDSLSVNPGSVTAIRARARDAVRYLNEKSL